MFKKQFIFIFYIFLFYDATFTTAQVYNDYYGLGHDAVIKSFSSGEENITPAISTLTGTGYFPDLAGSARFLSQATLGYNWEEINYVSNTGIKNWIEEQFEIAPVSYYAKYDSIYKYASNLLNNIGEQPEYIGFTFYESVLKQQDQLRQKVAFALSQILVLSLSNRGYASTSYYDALYLNAFGNYRDILQQVTHHPAMGIYLNTFKNRKADFALNTYPDENYARELMQLFSIGLWQLNIDGSQKLDNNGQPIRTYNIADIEQLAKVFTGLGVGGSTNNQPASFLVPRLYMDVKIPMAVYDAYHDKSTKQLIDGTILPYNQLGADDINTTLDVLFNHPNVGPFISIRLIQHLVKSNPSSQYIKRVASKFNNNGNGVRGDLKTVIRAIFLDPEARECNYIDYSTSGKLIQPLERMLNLYKAFNISTPSNKFYLNDAVEFKDAIEQAFMRAPTVFNFFTPFFGESDFVEQANLVSPEFEILNTYTTIAYINLLENALKEKPFANYTTANSTGYLLAENTNDVPTLNFAEELNLISNDGISALLERLDVLLCRGQLTFDNKIIIENTINQNFANVATYTNEDAIKDAIYYIMLSPNYTILK